MREKLGELDKRDALLFAVDPHESYRVRHMLRDAGTEVDEVSFPVLADPASTVSASYGVAFQMQVHTERANRPATFIIDKQGVLRFAHRGKKYSDRPKLADIIDELDKLTGK